MGIRLGECRGLLDTELFDVEPGVSTWRFRRHSHWLISVCSGIMIEGSTEKKATRSVEEDDSSERSDRAS